MVDGRVTIVSPRLHKTYVMAGTTRISDSNRESLRPDNRTEPHFGYGF